MPIESPSQLIKRPVNSLIPYDRNPKIHPDSQINQLVESIKEWGWTVPILIDEDDNVIAGHGRLYAAQKLEMDDVPCLVIGGLSEAQKKAYVIADNKLGENGDWDMGLYFSELKEISEQGFDLSVIGTDIDVSSLNYQPDLQPMTEYPDIQERDMINAGNKLGDNINRISANTGADSVEVVCPSCAHTFRFDK
tara:strand:+ start:6591 stop:7169 length:579 start_codon:yes stop_codon:yes gene_type:complete